VVDSTLDEEKNLPFQRVTFDHSIPFIEGNLNGVKVHALWDTGTSMSIIDCSMINNYPNIFHETDTRALSADYKGQNKEIPIYHMDTLKIGGHLFPRQMVAAMDLSHFSEYMEQPIDLIIGYNTISKANWVFDFPNNKWAILKMIERPVRLSRVI